MNASKQGYKRTQVLVDRKFQIQFVTRLAVVLASSLALFFVLSVMAPAAFGLFGGNPNWGVMKAVFRAEVLLYAVALPLICTFLCLFGQGIRETFRIAGPNQRFRIVFQDMANLQIPRGVRIRKDDYLQETAQDMSTALATIHREVASLQFLSEQAVELLDAEQESGQETSAQLRDLIQQIHRSADRFELVTEAPVCEPMTAREAAAVESEVHSESSTEQPANV